jgi:hypothetical protein
MARKFTPWEPSDDDDSFTPDVRDVLYGPGYDAHAQELMFQGIAEENSAAYSELIDYLWQRYGIDLERDWHWEDFREWYNAQ